VLLNSSAGVWFSNGSLACDVAPAIANRLAAAALKSIPYSTIETSLIRRALGAIREVFFRRLGYLDSNAEAVLIVQRWFRVGGWLDKVADFNDFGATILNTLHPWRRTPCYRRSNVQSWNPKVRT